MVPIRLSHMALSSASPTLPMLGVMPAGSRPWAGRYWWGWWSPRPSWYSVQSTSTGRSSGRIGMRRGLRVLQTERVHGRSMARPGSPRRSIWAAPNWVFTQVEVHILDLIGGNRVGLATASPALEIGQVRRVLGLRAVGTPAPPHVRLVGGEVVCDARTGPNGLVRPGDRRTVCAFRHAGASARPDDPYYPIWNTTPHPIRAIAACGSSSAPSPLWPSSRSST